LEDVDPMGVKKKKKLWTTVLEIRKHVFAKEVIKEINRLEGGYCNICHEKYVGLAQDCRCTNYGR